MRSLAVALVAAAMILPARADAVTLRYLLVVGNNYGVDTGGNAEVALRHAESDAQQLRDRLVALSGFDADGPRTVLLLGATRAQVRDAAARIAERKAADLETLGDAKTLFAMFFTGHGLRGELLLNDGPLSGEAIGMLFRDIGADFNIGMFDACYSGSLGDDLAGKGMTATPGLSLFRELPDEVLTAEGSVWFVSSSPEQASYEDKKLGGLFTHFFTEALDAAERDGPGITLERIWSYAHRRTVEHAAARGRRQTPQRVTRLKSSGPLYFSFPLERRATLVLADSLEGQFLLSYDNGPLTEIIDKRRGTRQELAVFAGSAWLTKIAASEVQMQERVDLRDGATLVLHEEDETEEPVGFGQSLSPLWQKGVGERTLRATTIEPGVSIQVGAGYGWTPTSEVMLNAAHAVSAEARLDVGRLTAGLGIGYGIDNEAFATWAYDLQALNAAAGVGWVVAEPGPTRLALGARLGLTHVWQRFADETTRSGFSLQAAAQADLLVSLPARLALNLWLRGGGVVGPGAGVESAATWRSSVGLGAAVLVKID